MKLKRIASQSFEGVIGDISFVLVGPPELVEAIIKYIRNLTRAYENNGG